MEPQKEICLAKLYDGFPDGETKLEFLDTLDERQFQEFQISIAEIEELHNIRRLMNFVFINDQEIHDYINSIMEELKAKSDHWNNVKRHDGDKLFLTINRLFLNYLSSVRTFLDHSETIMNRKFGKNSSQFLQFKKNTNNLFDNSFAYRFFYQLRNYAQHVGLPLSDISFNTEYDRENNWISGKLNICFDKNKLLENFDDWKKVKKDLEDMEGNFEMIPLMIEVTHSIIKIEKETEYLISDGLFKATNFITQLTKHLQTDKGEIFVAYDLKTGEKGELKTFQSINIPFATMNSIQTLRHRN